MRTFAMVKAVKLLLRSKHSEGHKNEQTVAFDFKKIRQIYRKV